MSTSPSNPEVRAFNRIITCRTVNRQEVWLLNRGDRITHIKRGGGKVEFEFADTVDQTAKLEMDWVTFTLSTDPNPETGLTRKPTGKKGE